MYKVWFSTGVKMKRANITATSLPNDSKFKRENIIQRADLFKALGESVGYTEWSKAQNVQGDVFIVLSLKTSFCLGDLNAIIEHS